MVADTMPPAQDPPPRTIKMDSWPTLGEAIAPSSAAAAASASEHPPTDDGDDWEFIGTDDEEDGSAASPGRGRRARSNPKILHRSASTPDFGNYDPPCPGSSSEGEGDDDDDDTKVTTVTDASSAVLVPTIPSSTAGSASAGVWGSPDPSSKGGTPRRPSFRDAILLNAEKSEEEEAATAAHRAETAERLQREREAHRKARARKTRLVVTPIKRCAKSTGDLKGLVSIEEHGEDALGEGGGGGGGGGVGPIAEHGVDEHGGCGGGEEVLGDTDAMDFYHRKARGQQNRKSGQMERPDEAKRKEISMYKKDVQRQRQHERAQGGEGGGGGGGGGEGKAKAKTKAKAKANKGGKEKEGAGGFGKGGKGGGGGRKR